MLQEVLMLAIRPLHMLLERRLNVYGKLTWQEVEYLLWREGNTDGSYIVSESIKHPSCVDLPGTAPALPRCYPCTALAPL